MFPDETQRNHAKTFIDRLQQAAQTKLSSYYEQFDSQTNQKLLTNASTSLASRHKAVKLATYDSRLVQLRAGFLSVMVILVLESCVEKLLGQYLLAASPNKRLSLDTSRIFLCHLTSPLAYSVKLLDPRKHADLLT